MIVTVTRNSYGRMQEFVLDEVKSVKPDTLGHGLTLELENGATNNIYIDLAEGDFWEITDDRY